MLGDFRLGRKRAMQGRGRGQSILRTKSFRRLEPVEMLVPNIVDDGDGCGVNHIADVAALAGGGGAPLLSIHFTPPVFAV